MPAPSPTVRPSRSDTITDVPLIEEDDSATGVDEAEAEAVEETPEAEAETGAKEDDMSEATVDSDEDLATDAELSRIVDNDDDIKTTAPLSDGAHKFFGAAVPVAGALACTGIIVASLLTGGILPALITSGIILTAALAAWSSFALGAVLGADKKKAKEVAAGGKINEDSKKFKALTPYERYLARKIANQGNKERKKNLKYLSRHSLSGVQETNNNLAKYGKIAFVGAAAVAVGAAALVVALSAGATAAGIGLALTGGALAAVLLGIAVFKGIDNWAKNRTKKQQKKVRDARVALIKEDLIAEKSKLQDEKEELQEQVDDIEVEMKELKEKIDDIQKMIDNDEDADGNPLTDDKRRELVRKKQRLEEKYDAKDVELNGDPKDKDDYGLKGKIEDLDDELERINHDLKEAEKTGEEVNFISKIAAEGNRNYKSGTTSGKKYIDDQLDELKTNGFVKDIIRGVRAAFGQAAKDLGNAVTLNAFSEETKKKRQQRDRKKIKEGAGLKTGAPTR